nr:retrovirus-related Pol polyprotein from transposon TNT 1-94 [Tanacetum cinerariifolium]
MTGNLKLLINFIWKFMGTVRFENDHVAAILGFGDLQWGNILITRVYFIEGLGYNLFSVGQFCDSDLEVAFRRDACFIKNLEGVDLLKGDRSTNLYTINLNEMASASPICLMARAFSTKNDLVAGLPKFKYHKEHLCPSCEQGKSKRASHPPKPVLNLRQRLHLLHMDLCGPMRIASISGKRYILVIVDDYSRYTWVHFLRSKDEAPEVIIKFLKRITVLLQSPVIIIRADNGIEFKNQVLTEFFDTVGISHQMSSVRTPQQNGVVERRNQTLVEELINERKLDISFLHVFGALCYPKNDREDIGKLGAKGDIGFFIGVPPAQEPQVHQSSTASTTIADTAPIPTNSSSLATNILISSHDVDEFNPNAMVDEFKNQVLKVYFDSVGISHQMSSVRTPQQNRVMERRNRTLVEAARTIKPDISFLHVFGALCYPKNDREDIGKLGAKGDIGLFIGYSVDSCAYRIYNRRTKKIIETMNVSFDELSAMDFEQCSSKPRLQCMTSGKISSCLDLTYAPSTITKQQPTKGELDLLFKAMYNDYFGGQPLATMENVLPTQEPQVRQTSGLDLTYAPSTITTQQPTEGELDLLFEAMYDDYIGGQPSADLRYVSANQAHQVCQTSTISTSIADTVPTPTNSSSQATNFPNTSQDVDGLRTQQQRAQQQRNQASLQSETVADNVLNAMFDANSFVNLFANPSTSAAESSSSQNVDPSNMHTFYQPYPHEF